MDLTEHEEGHEHAAVSLKVLLLVFAIVLIGALGYFVWLSNNAPDTTDNSTVTVTKQTEPTNTQSPDQPQTASENTSSNEIKDWKSVVDTGSKIQFSYPPTWIAPEKGDVIATGDDPTPYSYTQYILNKQNEDQVWDNTLEISTFAEIGKNEITTTYLSQLKKVYQDRSATSLGSETKIWLPPSNASVFASSKPEYIETNDKVWRGITYIGNVGQDACVTQLTNHTILTDNNNYVVQLNNRADTAKKNEFTSLFDTNGCNEATVKQLNDYIKSLTMKSTTEPVVNNFNSYHKLIALSLRFAK